MTHRHFARSFPAAAIATLALLHPVVGSAAGESSGGSAPTGPAHAEDARVQVEWEERVRTKGGDDDNQPAIREPMLSTILGRDYRIPHTRQADDFGNLSNLLTLEQRLAGSPVAPTFSSTGNLIKPDGVKDPHRVLGFAASKLSAAAGRGDTTEMHEAADEILDVLLGRTEGYIFDGFPLLNVNRWKYPDVEAHHYSPDTVPGEYKMKTLRPVLDPETGEQVTEPSWKHDGTRVRVWQIDVDHLWYDQQFDSDTFLIKIPYRVRVGDEDVVVDWNDTLRINWTIYSLVEEDFAPTQVMRDALVDDDLPGPSRGGSVRFPFKGEDTVWVRIGPGTVSRMTVQHTALRFVRGVYTWGWNVHPPRIQFLQPIFEYLDPDTGEPAWDWQAASFAYRNREDLTVDNVADAAPEKKLYRIARAVLDGSAGPAGIRAMLEQAQTAPLGTWSDWLALMIDQRQLPPEAKAMLDERGKTIDDYDFVTVYMNNEMYGAGPLGHTVRLWSQGEEMHAALINLDHHTHYFRNVGFGAPLHNDLSRHFDDGVFSFEIMNFKPLYGAPKVAEMQYRAGWGFRPHFSVVQQGGVFPRVSDRRQLKPYAAPLVGLPIDENGVEVGPDGAMRIYWGYQYTNAEEEPFPFNPPPFIIGTVAKPSFDTLYDLGRAPHHEADGDLLYRDRFLTRAARDLDAFKGKTDAQGEPLVASGLVIGQRTEGWGRAQMCPEDPLGTFCTADLSEVHPLHKKNWPAPNDPSVAKTELRFPPFLRNPCQEGNGVCGDIIPPTGAWEPFLFLNPANGTIFNDPADPSAGFWTDYTYAHGRTIYAGDYVEATIEMPRAGAQLFYQFDDLFHDNAIFSPHPVLDVSLFE